MIGFLAGSADIRKCYVSVISKDWPSLAFLSLRSVLRPKMLNRILTLVMYPIKYRPPTEHNFEACNKIHAEILTIAINPGYQRKGIGQRLVEAFEDQLRHWNVRGYYRVATNIIEVNSNSFYKKAGFIPCHETKHNDLTLQVYVKEIASEIVADHVKED